MACCGIGHGPRCINSLDTVSTQINLAMSLLDALLLDAHRIDIFVLRHFFPTFPPSLFHRGNGMNREDAKSGKDLAKKHWAHSKRTR